MFPSGGASVAVGLVGRAAELGRRRPARNAACFVELAAKLGEQPIRRLVPDAERLHRPTQCEQRVAPAARQQRLGLGAPDEHLVELPSQQRLRVPLDGGDARPALLGLDLQARLLCGRSLGCGRGVTGDRLELDRRRRIVRARRLELRAQRTGQGRGGLATQDDALTAAPQPVERCSRLLARTGGIGELFLSLLALGDERRDLLVEDPALLGRLGAAGVGLATAFGQAREVERRDRSLQPRDLEPELLGPLGGGRL